jgi:hypothetical protein
MEAEREAKGQENILGSYGDGGRLGLRPPFEIRTHYPTGLPRRPVAMEGRASARLDVTEHVPPSVPIPHCLDMGRGQRTRLQWDEGVKTICFGGKAHALWCGSRCATARTRCAASAISLHWCGSACASVRKQVCYGAKRVCCISNLFALARKRMRFDGKAGLLRGKADALRRQCFCIGVKAHALSHRTPWY